MKTLCIILFIVVGLFTTFEIGAAASVSRRRVINPPIMMYGTGHAAIRGRTIDDKYYDYRIQLSDIDGLTTINNDEILDIKIAIKAAKKYITLKYPSITDIRLRELTLNPLKIYLSKGGSKYISTFVYTIVLYSKQDEPWEKDIRYGLKVLMNGKVIGLTERPSENPDVIHSVVPLKEIETIEADEHNGPKRKVVRKSDG